jgi:hypothetical protein
MITPGPDGRITCPNCHIAYVPVLERKDQRPIQEQYPDAPRWQREQLISGLGCDFCLYEFLGQPTEGMNCTCGE